MPITAREKLSELLTEGQNLKAKGVLSADENERFGHILEEANGLKAQIENERSFDGFNDFAGKSAGVVPLTGANVDGQTYAGEAIVETSPGATKGSTAVKMIDQFGPGILSNKQIMATTTTEYKEAFKSYLRYGERGIKHDALKTLQEGQDTEGGFLLPVDFLNKIISKEPTPTRVAGRVTQLNTSRDTMVVPRVNYTTDDIYTTGIRSTWTGEIPASSTAMRVTDPVFGQSRIPVYTNMLSMPLTMDFVEDSSFDVEGWVSGKFSETIDLLKDNMVLNGTGQGQPTGILNAPGADSSQPAVVNLGNPITADGLISIGFALPEQYDQNAAYFFSKTSTGPVVAKLKDSNNRYLWGAGLQDSGLSPDLHGRRLLGYDVVMSEYMPAVGANHFPVLFGDVRGYYMANRIGISVRVLNELYAETNQILVIGRVRFGGQVAEAWRMKVGKQA